MSGDISSTMLVTLREIAHRGGEVVCLKGGFWTYPLVAMNERGVPVWYVSTNTIRALSSRGLLALRTVPPFTFMTHGSVTDAGMVVVAGAKAKETLPEGQPVEGAVVSESGRPDFGAMAKAIRNEAKWVSEFHARDRTGQALSDSATLNHLADSIERVAKHLGYEP